MKLSVRILGKLWFLQLFALIVNSISWWVVWDKIRPTAEQLPLHYNVFYGTDAVGAGYYLYTVPAIGLFLLLASAALIAVVKRRDHFAAAMLVSSVIAAEILILLATLFLRSVIAV